MGCLSCEVGLSCTKRYEKVYAAYTRSIIISPALRLKRAKMLKKKKHGLSPYQVVINDGYLLASATK